MSYLFLDLNQWVTIESAAVAERNQCSQADAEYCVRARITEWWEESIAAIKEGNDPPQWWVDQVSGRGQYTRWESFLKHNPNVFDRLAKLGLSLYEPKAALKIRGESRT